MSALNPTFSFVVTSQLCISYVPAWVGDQCDEKVAKKISTMTRPRNHTISRQLFLEKLTCIKRYVAIFEEADQTSIPPLTLVRCSTISNHAGIGRLRSIQHSSHDSVFVFLKLITACGSSAGNGRRFGLCHSPLLLHPNYRVPISHRAIVHPP